MGTWDVMRRGDHDDRYRMATHESRIAAMAHALALESGPQRETYWVLGPPGPVLRTRRDLYLHLLLRRRQIQPLLQLKSRWRWLPTLSNRP